MSGPQFVHIQTWSNKANKAGRNIEFVINELERVPECATHVEAPLPPRPLFGDPTCFAEEHKAHVAARSTWATMADGSQRQRAIRSDRHTMASIVVSYPVPRSVIVTDKQKEALAIWEKRNLAWLQKKYGTQLRMVAAHDDETHPHLHAWLLPDDPGADATTLHPGKVAKKAVEAEAKAKGMAPRQAVKLGNRALKEAMVLWQDDYYAEVSAPLGLTRTGPKRRRLSREQWKAEKVTAHAHAATMAQAAASDAASKQMSAEAREERAEARRLLLAAKEQRAMLFQREADLAKRERSLGLEREAIVRDQALIKREQDQIAYEISQLDAGRDELAQKRGKLDQGTAAVQEIYLRVKYMASIIADIIGHALPKRLIDGLAEIEASVEQYRLAHSALDDPFTNSSEFGAESLGPDL